MSPTTGTVNKKHLFRLSFIIALLVSAPLGADVSFHPCTLSPPGFPGGLKASCGTYAVLENPSQSEGRKIELRVAVMRARSDSPAPDPVFFFAGGPGQSAVDAYPIMSASLEPLRRHRDIVLIDQRGTGESNPLNCEADESLDSQDIDFEQLRASARDCLEALDGDPRFYTTTIAVSDFDKVRQAMGYDKINVIGVSYGTRAAQVYLRNFPDTVRSIVLDGVVPQDLVLGSEHAIKLDQTLHNLFARCRQDEQCNNHFPNLAANLQTLIKQAKQKPVTVNIPGTRDGKKVDVTVTRDMLALVVRLLTYSPETQALLPLMLHEAATQGNLDRLAGQALRIMESLSASVSRGMELSVVCAEDVPHFSSDPELDNTLMGSSMIEDSREQCSVWPRGDAPDDFHKPYSSDLPVLLLSGEYDPVTPPEYGERALQQFANGLHLTVKGQGHSVATRGCVPTIISQFFDRGTTENLDTSCLDKMGDTPFFTTLLGPEP